MSIRLYPVLNNSGTGSGKIISDPDQDLQHRGACFIIVILNLGICDDEQIKDALDQAREPSGGFNLHKAIDLLMSTKLPYNLQITRFCFILTY
jgi:hypothetical protein